MTLITAGLAGPDRVVADDVIVNCYDDDRGVVQKMRRGQCGGTVVSDAEAAAIGKDRRDYVRQAFNQRPTEFGDGNQLKGIGTGFFVSTDGMLVTNLHVVRNCNVISVSTTDGQSRAGQLRGWDNSKDLALLQVDMTPSAVARIIPRPPYSGSVAMVGYPDQGIPPIKPLLTTGRTLGTERIGDSLTVLKIEADVRPGNSGGPLLDQQGNVLGVVFAEINTPKVFRSTGKIIRNVGYVIPSKELTTFLNRWRVDYWSGAAAPASRDLLASAHPYVARVGCWR